MLAYLRILVNPDDDAAFLRIINTPRRELGPTTLEKLGAYANQRHISLFSACGELGLAQTVSAKSHVRLQKFYDWAQSKSRKIEYGDTFVQIEEMLDDVGYENWLRENANSPAAAERKMNNVLELIAWLKRIARRDAEQEKPLAEIIAGHSAHGYS